MRASCSKCCRVSAISRRAGFSTVRWWRSMADLVPLVDIPTMAPGAIARVREVEQDRLGLDQFPVHTDHVIHAGMYARTVIIPAGHLLTGVLVKVPTILIFQGDAIFYIGDGSVRMTGYHVLTAN